MAKSCFKTKIKAAITNKQDTKTFIDILEDTGY